MTVVEVTDEEEQDRIAEDWAPKPEPSGEYSVPPPEVVTPEREAELAARAAVFTHIRAALETERAHLDALATACGEGGAYRDTLEHAPAACNFRTDLWAFLRDARPAMRRIENRIPSEA